MSNSRLPTRNTDVLFVWWELRRWPVQEVEANDSTPPLQRQIAGGLNFPGDTAPDYLDFAYFSFVIGMTSQVSDVALLSKPMRRLALLHGVLAFFFNTSIIALSINTLSNVLQH